MVSLTVKYPFFYDSPIRVSLLITLIQGNGLAWKDFFIAQNASRHCCILWLVGIAPTPLSVLGYLANTKSEIKVKSFIVSSSALIQGNNLA